MRRPRPFSDSFTTHEATLSVDVTPPFGEKSELVSVKIDCNGMVSFDEDGVDLVIEMLMNARGNLRARRHQTVTHRANRAGS